MYEILLPCHIFAGGCALLAAVSALATPKGYRWHVYSGRVFAGGMLVVFLTAIPMALVRRNLFLLLVAIFSFYLAFTGWRSARNRSGVASALDWGSAAAMVIAAIAMAVMGIPMVLSGYTMGIVLLVFSGIGGGSGFADLRRFRRQPLIGRKRIARHLTRMLGGTIATVTAFVVTNFSFSPAFVLWLAPTVFILPVILYWNVVTLSPAKEAPPFRE